MRLCIYKSTKHNVCCVNFYNMINCLILTKLNGFHSVIGLYILQYNLNGMFKNRVISYNNFMIKKNSALKISHNLINGNVYICI